LKNEPPGERVKPIEDESLKLLRLRMEKHPEWSETAELTEENKRTQLLKDAHL